MSFFIAAVVLAHIMRASSWLSKVLIMLSIYVVASFLGHKTASISLRQIALALKRFSPLG
jgi:Ca2+/H+ antiporter